MVRKHSTHIEWQHFEAILRVSRAPSVRQAASALGVAHTTLAKRVADAEEAFGAVAFVRGPQGYVLTDAGREIKAYAERMEKEAQDARLAVLEHDVQPRGRVVVSVMAPVLSRVLAPSLPAFARRFPGLDIVFKTSYRIASINKQKADIAVRFQNSPDDYLVGRRVVTQCEALYAAAEFDHRQAPGDALPVIGWADRADVEVRARRHGLDSIHIVCTVEELEAQRALVLNGAGIGLLPCYVCADDARLIRWSDKPALPINDGWVLTHPDLAGSTRVRLVADFCFESLKAASNLFLGVAR